MIFLLCNKHRTHFLLSLYLDFKKTSPRQKKHVFNPDVSFHFSESGLQDLASPMIWKYIANLNVEEIGKALFCFLYLTKVNVKYLTQVLA